LRLHFQLCKNVGARKPVTNSIHDFFAIEFPGATSAEAAIIAQECAAKLREAGVPLTSIQVARTDQEAMDLGGVLLVAGTIAYAFLKGVAEGVVEDAGEAVYEKIKTALVSLSRRHRTTILIKGTDGNAGTIGHDFQTATSSGKGGAGLGKLGIVLLGASEFPYMNDQTLNNAAFGRSAALAKTLFSPPYTAFAKTEVLDLFDKDMPPVDVLDAIEQHIDAHPDMHDLLVYYCGHGSFQKDKTYYLLLRSTRAGRESVTGFAPRAFRQDLELRLVDKRVYFVVDCCFSGAFVDSLQSGSLESTVEEQFSLDMPRQGWTVLTASAKDKVAMAPKGETYTMFTGALAHVIERGTPTAGVRFNLLDLTDATRAYVAGAWQRQAVMPQCISPRQAEGDIARLPIFLNKYRAESKSEPSSGHMLGALDRAGPGRTEEPVVEMVPPSAASFSDKQLDRAIELAYWQTIGSSTTPGDFRRFLQRFPEGEFAELARSKLNELSEVQWVKVKLAGEASLIEAFLAEFPENVHAADAKEAIANLLRVLEKGAVDDAQKRDGPTESAKVWVAALFALSVLPSQFLLAVLFDSKNGFLAAFIIALISAGRLVRWRHVSLTGVEIGLYWLGCTAGSFGATGLLFANYRWNWVGASHTDNGGFASGLLAAFVIALISARLLVRWRRASLTGVEIVLYWLGCTAGSFVAAGGLFVANEWNWMGAEHFIVGSMTSGSLAALAIAVVSAVLVHRRFKGLADERVHARWLLGTLTVMAIVVFWALAKNSQDSSSVMIVLVIPNIGLGSAVILALRSRSYEPPPSRARVEEAATAPLEKV
jgi:hypothetical protein